jgi:small-conductance mechanosensitive channel
LTPGAPLYPHISYAYIPTDGYAYTQLKYICLAAETGAHGLATSATLYVARGNANPLLDAAVSIGGAIINTFGNVITAATLLRTVFGLPTGGLLTAAGFITWGLGLFIQMTAVADRGRAGLLAT